MASKTLIGGTGYSVKGGRTLVGGTAYQVKKGRTLINGTGQNINFGTPVASLPVGTVVYLNENGTKRGWIVVNVGAPTWKDNAGTSPTNNDGTYAYGDTTMYDNADGIWLLRERVLPDKVQWNTAGTNFYPNSTLDTFLNNTYINRFNANIRNAMLAVKIPYADVGSYSYYHAGPNGWSTHIFVLSVEEVNAYKLRDSYTWGPAFGYVLDYFSGTDAVVKRRAMDDVGETEMSQLTRSPVTCSKDHAGNRTIFIYESGGLGKNNPVASTVSDMQMARPCMVLSKSVRVDSNMNIIT